MSTRVHTSMDLFVTPEPEDTPMRISIQGSLATVKINWLPDYLGYSLRSMRELRLGFCISSIEIDHMFPYHRLDCDYRYVKTWRL